MKYGTCVYGETWDNLMESARDLATISGTRIKVVASANSPRMEKVLGGAYSYNKLLPEYYGVRRCGMRDTDKGPCILARHSTYFNHISRTKNPALFLIWSHYSLSKPRIITREQAIGEGMIDE